MQSFNHIMFIENERSRPMAVTLRELATLANTSITTVSRVINNKPGISQKRRESIMRLAKEMGYQPNVLARNLVMQKRHILGLIASTLSNPVYVEFFHLTAARCRERDYQVLVADSEYDLDKEEENINMMLQYQAEGLLIFPVSDSKRGVDLQHFLNLQLRGIPFVVVGEAEGYNFDCVTSEELESSARLARHLVELGHKRIGVVGVDPENRCAVRRLEGIESALPDGGPALRTAGGTEDEWVQEVVSWFDDGDRPTALVTMNDGIALRLYRPLMERGLSIPDDVSIVTFENDFWTELVQPSLTTSAPDNAEVARLAFDTLMQRIENPKKPPIVKKVPQRFIQRESSAAVSDIA
jgi:LacI family transcriptional regulator